MKTISAAFVVITYLILAGPFMLLGLAFEFCYHAFKLGRGMYRQLMELE